MIGGFPVRRSNSRFWTPPITYYGTGEALPKMRAAKSRNSPRARTLVTAQRDRFERIKDDELRALCSELEAAVKADPDTGHALPRFSFDPYAFCETDNAAVPLDPENICEQMRTFSFSKARASATTPRSPSGVHLDQHSACSGESRRLRRTAYLEP